MNEETFASPTNRTAEEDPFITARSNFRNSQPSKLSVDDETPRHSNSGSKNGSRTNFSSLDQPEKPIGQRVKKLSQLLIKSH
jgi:hypothetical protein